jgi:hypothetical protein
MSRDAEPEVELRDMLRHATEGQEPATSPAPSVAHGVEAVGTNAHHGDAQMTRLSTTAQAWMDELL